MSELHPSDKAKFQWMYNWIKGFRGDHVRNNGASVYVGSGASPSSGASQAWQPRLYIVISEENDYLVCSPHWQLNETTSTTQVKVAKPIDMRGGEERWSVTPAYVPNVSLIWVAPMPDNGCTDEEDKPVVLMDMNLDGRSAAGFWGKVTDKTADGTNHWTYTAVEQSQGESGWSDLADGRTVTLVENGGEANNSGSGVQGNGVDLDGQIFADNASLELKEIRGNPIVWIVRTYDTSTGAAVYAFSKTNAIDGTCG